jgi:hypothetical protein
MEGEGGGRRSDLSVHEALEQVYRLLPRVQGVVTGVPGASKDIVGGFRCHVLNENNKVFITKKKEGK